MKKPDGFMRRRLLAGMSLGIIMMGILILSGCSSPLGKRQTLSAMQLQERTLSEEEQELISLIDTHTASKIFRYRMDDRMKYLSLTVEELKDGKLTVLAQAGGPAAAEGDFAVLADTDEVIFSWDGGKYSCVLENVYGYQSNITSHLTGLSSVSYNKQEAVLMIASTDSDSIRSSDVTDYHNLLSLQEKDYDRVLFLTAAFLDFEPKDELVSYNGTVRDRSVLSPETVKWLEHYNQMDISFQPMLSSVPTEFIDITGGTKADETAAQDIE